jgi:hypothetical protein
MLNDNAPVAYPEVVIGGVPYLLKFGSGALIRLERLGIPAGKLGESIEEANASGHGIEMMFKLLSAGLVTPKPGGKGWKSIGMTPEELADFIDDAEVSNLAAIVSSALGKASPAEVSPAPPAEVPATEAA